MGRKQGRKVNSAFIAPSTRGVGKCSSGNRINVFASSRKQTGNPNDKPLISSSLAVCHEWVQLALMALHYKREAKKENKYVLSILLR